MNLHQFQLEDRADILASGSVRKLTDGKNTSNRQIFLIPTNLPYSLKKVHIEEFGPGHPKV